MRQVWDMIQLVEGSSGMLQVLDYMPRNCTNKAQTYNSRTWKLKQEDLKFKVISNHIACLMTDCTNQEKQV